MTKLHLEDYIDSLSKITSLPVGEIEKVVHTQVAMILGDLAVEGIANTWLGSLKVKDSTLQLQPNETIKGVLKNDVDPLVVLREMSQNE
jgi:hypothetical protein